MMIVKNKLRHKWISQFYIIVGLVVLPCLKAEGVIFYSSDETKSDIHTILYNNQVVEETDVGLFSSLNRLSFAPLKLNVFYRHFSDLEQRNYKSFKKQVHIKVFTWNCDALFKGVCFINCDQQRDYYRQCKRGISDIQKFFKSIEKNLNRYASREKTKAQRLNEQLEKIYSQSDSWVDQLVLCDNMSEEISELSGLLTDLFKKGEDLQNFREIFNTVKHNYADFPKQIEALRDELGGTEEDEIINKVLDVLERLYGNKIIPNFNSFIYDFIDSYDHFNSVDVENLLKTLLDSILHLLSISRTNILDTLEQIRYDVMEATTAFTEQQSRFEHISGLIPKNIRYSIIKTKEAISEYEQIQKVKKPIEVDYRYHHNHYSGNLRMREP